MIKEEEVRKELERCYKILDNNKDEELCFIYQYKVRILHWVLSG